MDELAKHFIEDEPRTHIGDLAGVEVAVTRGWWVQPLGMLLGGQLLGRFLGKKNHHVRSGIRYSTVLATAGVVHQLGHIASARMVEAPMDTLLVTPVRTFTLYDDTADTVSKDQHRGRAIGGPAANISAGVVALLVSLVVRNRSLRAFGILSTFVGFGALIPAAGNDGEELFRNKHD